MAELNVSEIEEEEERNEALLELVRSKKFRTLRQVLSEMNEVDVAAFIEELDPEKTVVVFRMLPKELASDVFACLELDKQQHIVSSITDKELTNIIEDLSVDDAVDMVEELPANIVKRVLQNATPETRSQINEFLKYPENSAGSIMTAEYIGLRKTMTVEDAFAYIRQNGVDKETIYTCYVMDNKRTLEGVITVKDLLMNPYETLIEDIMDTRIIKARTTDDREDVVDLFNKYDLTTLPVVDTEDRLVGIITVDDAVDVMEEEATEDFEKMAAMMPSEKPYLKTGVFEMAKHRILWLMILMISATVTGGILAKYEEAFAEDLEKKDAAGNQVQTRVDMYNPLYYFLDHYDGSGSSEPAGYWRIRSGICQGDTALTTETNLALAIASYGPGYAVDFETVWGMGHTMAERKGESTANFIAWVRDCMGGNAADKEIRK